MRRMQKRDAQPLSKDSLLDLLHGDVKNLCEKVKHQRKAEIAENIKQKSYTCIKAKIKNLNRLSLY